MGKKSGLGGDEIKDVGEEERMQIRAVLGGAGKIEKPRISAQHVEQR